ncbi:hypothetical protein FKM82_023276 [Ascaphus truei]
MGRRLGVERRALQITSKVLWAKAFRWKTNDDKRTREKLQDWRKPKGFGLGGIGVEEWRRGLLIFVVCCMVFMCPHVFPGVFPFSQVPTGQQGKKNKTEMGYGSSEGDNSRRDSRVQQSNSHG